AIDLINAIANPTTTTANAPAATGTPVALGSSLANTYALHGTNVSSLGAPGTTSAYALAPQSPQTFVSQDLSQTPAVPRYAPQPVISSFAFLQNVKQVLLSIFLYLRPFGGTTPNVALQENANAATAIMN